MDDPAILKRINDLVSEEHALLDHEGAEGPAPQHQQRLQEVQDTLDQCWDLLRQRRALREYGLDPAQAQVRPSSTVERYQQ